jgi:hypothetical protein
MGQTFKDSSGKRSRTTELKVVKREDGAFDLYWNGAVEDHSVPERWLQERLTARHGISGEELATMLHDLDESGEARFVF